MKRDKEKTTLEIHGYFKKGDDFYHYLKDFSPRKALELWGADLIDMGKALQKAAELLAACQDLEADGNTHHAEISNVDRKLADEILKISYFHEDLFCYDCGKDDCEVDHYEETPEDWPESLPEDTEN